MLRRSLLLLLVLATWSSPALAGWQTGTVGLDGTGVNLGLGDREVNDRRPAVYFYFTSGSQSGWLFIANGITVEVCLNDDADQETHGLNNALVKILSLTHVEDKTPANEDSIVLLSVTLDGTDSPSAATTACIKGVDGPRWIRAAPQGAPTSGAYISVIARSPPFNF